MTLQLPKAKTQYSDLTGTASMDFHGGAYSDLWKYAAHHGINTSDFQPVGLNFT